VFGIKREAQKLAFGSDSLRFFIRFTPNTFGVARGDT
jgi:hypothetical protein